MDHREPGRAGGGPARRLLPHLLALAALGLLAWLAHGRWTRLELIGWDSFPSIAAARVGSFGDLLDGFREELMDGRFPHGRYYRPVTNLAFALDEAVHGLSPAGWHRTDLALCVVAGALALAVARRVGACGLPAAFLGGAFLVLHPVQLDVLPVLSQRADALALALVLATLLAQPLPEEPLRPARAAAVLVLALLAAGAKETGALVGPLLVAHGLALGAGARRALLRAWPGLAAVALYVLARTLVLGGAGGHAEATPLEGLAGVLAYPGDLLRFVLLPQEAVAARGPALALAAALGSALLAAGVVAARARDGAEQRGPRALLALAALWLLGLWLVTSLAGRVERWYALPFVGALALGLAALLEAARRAWRGGARTRAGVLLAAVALAALPSLAASPLFVPYPELARASGRQARFFQSLAAAVARAPQGEAVVVGGPPLVETTERAGPRVSPIKIQHVYGVQAWLDLVFPERVVRAELYSGRPPRAREGELLVVLAPREMVVTPPAAGGR